MQEKDLELILEVRMIIKPKPTATILGIVEEARGRIQAAFPCNYQVTLINFTQQVIPESIKHD